MCGAFCVFTTQVASLRTYLALSEAMPSPAVFRIRLMLRGIFRRYAVTPIGWPRPMEPGTPRIDTRKMSETAPR